MQPISPYDTAARQLDLGARASIDLCAQDGVRSGEKNTAYHMHAEPEWGGIKSGISTMRKMGMQIRNT